MTDKDIQSLINHDYYYSHREQILMRKKMHYILNKEKILEYKKQRYRERTNGKD